MPRPKPIVHIPKLLFPTSLACFCSNPRTFGRWAQSALSRWWVFIPESQVPEQGPCAPAGAVTQVPTSTAISGSARSPTGAPPSLPKPGQACSINRGHPWAGRRNSPWGPVFTHSGCGIRHSATPFPQRLWMSHGPPSKTPVTCAVLSSSDGLSRTKAPFSITAT